MAEPDPLRIYFACVGNSARSQMAHAIAEHLGGEEVEVASGGSAPSGKVSGNARRAVEETGLDMEGHRSQPIDESFVERSDVVVTMGCGEDACPAFAEANLVDWPLRDPVGREMDVYRELRDDIEQRVRELLAERGALA